MILVSDDDDDDELTLMWGVSVGCMREAKQPLRCRSCKGFCSRYLSSLNTETERQKEPLTMEIKNTNTTKLCLVDVSTAKLHRTG